MDRHQAEAVLADQELVPCAQASVPEGKRLLDKCLAAEIPAILGADASCASGGCAPKVSLFVGKDDLPRVARLLHEEWMTLVAAEGAVPVAGGGPADPDAEPPCPACGVAAPLLDGACGECGLQLG